MKGRALPVLIGFMGLLVAVRAQQPVQDSLNIQWTPAMLSFYKASDEQSLEHILPRYARENPSGFAFLCRIEKKLEHKSPLAPWIKVDQINYLQPRQMVVQLKVFPF